MHHRCLVVFAVMSLLAAGCVDKTKGIVTGEVTVNGAKPERNGYISFIPVDGKGSTSGGEIADGKFEFESKVGMKRVEIRIPKVTGQKKLYNTPDSPIKDLMDESIDAKFNDNSEIQYEVVPGTQVINYDVTQKK
ncbi:MAG: hypothetical protein R3E01_20375 [Pirellulaceae bacterium]|nr:hypothetical protein [Planctomycetales bacterium]